MKTGRIVAWAILTAWEVGKRIEIDFEDIEKGKGLDHFIGQSLEYEKLSVPLNRLRPGDEKRPILFDRTDMTVGLEHGVKYAALISENDKDESRPYITCVGKYTDIENAKARKVAIHADQRAKLSVLENNIIYEVRVQGWKRRGTLRDIMDYFTKEWHVDPTETLSGDTAQWFEKDQNNRYQATVLVHGLPPVNDFLLKSLQKARA